MAAIISVRKPFTARHAPATKNLLVCHMRTIVGELDDRVGRKRRIRKGNLRQGLIVQVGMLANMDASRALGMLAVFHTVDLLEGLRGHGKRGARLNVNRKLLTVACHNACRHAHDHELLWCRELAAPVVLPRKAPVAR